MCIQLEERSAAEAAPVEATPVDPQGERPVPPKAGGQRLESVDALRGFNMFWIIGGAELFSALVKALHADWLHPVDMNLTSHAPWVGFRFHDMIFPLFLFIIGVTTPFALARRREKGASRGELVKHVLLRMLILFALGLVYNRALQLPGWEHVRIMGVLQRLALASALATLLYLFLDLRGQIAAGVGLLVVYFLAMRFLPVPGHPLGSMDETGNFANYVDRLIFLPGQLYKDYGDPEGLFSTIPAIVTALLGLFAGQWLQTSKSKEEKVRGLLIAGVIAIALGYAWSPFFPVIKKIWTSSYVLVAGGWSALILAAFYWIIDIRGWKRWAYFFLVIGLNPITIYVGQKFIDFEEMGKFFFGGLALHAGPLWGAVILGAAGVAARWLFLQFLYKRRIYLRV
jgi:predicted acyltransferase